MSIEVINHVWKNSKHKGSALLLMLAYADYANDQWIAWPSIESIAEKIRMSKRQTIRIRQTCIESGELCLIEEGGGGRKTDVIAVNRGDTTMSPQTAHGPDKLSPLTAARGDNLSGQTKQRGDNLSPQATNRGDNLSGLEVTNSTSRGDKFAREVTSATQRGDIAMSPEPLEPSIEPPIDPSTDRQTDASAGTEDVESPGQSVSSDPTTVDDLLKNYNRNDVSRALQIADANNARHRLRYAAGILKNWQESRRQLNQPADDGSAPHDSTTRAERLRYLVN